MRRITSTITALLFGLGFVWEWGKSALDWIGRALAMRDLSEGYEHARHAIEVWATEHTMGGSDIAPWFLMAIGAASILVLHVYPALVKRLSRSAIQFIFPAEANLDSKETLFRRSVCFLPEGKPQAQGRVCLHDYYIGVHNPSDKRTLKNVRVIVDSIGPPRMPWPVNKSLISEHTKSDVVDIPPLRTEYFFLGDYLDESDAGMFDPSVVGQTSYRDWVSARDLRRDEGLHVRLFGGHTYPLLRNDGTEIQIVAYADDTAPKEATLVANCRDGTKIQLR